MTNFTKAFLVVSALAIVGTQGKWNACGVGDYAIATKGFAQGFQSDILTLETDCFRTVTLTMAEATAFFNSFYFYKSDDFLAPLYHMSDLGIQITNAMTYCETVNFAKHLGIRTTSWGGFIELGLTILMSIVKNAA